jgi:phosphoglucosamine mutase
MNSPIRLAPEVAQNTGSITRQQPANLFGTDGIRARMGTFPCTEPDLVKLGRAIGIWALQKYGAQPRLLLGHDTRESAPFMINALNAGLLQSPISLSNLGVLPTPAIIKIALLDTSIDGAIIITASHNPYHDNGIKLIDRRAGKLSLRDEETISELFYKEATSPCDIRGKMYHVTRAQDTYKNAFAEYFTPNFLHGKKIVLDCANGATSAVAPELFTHFGATVLPLYNQPNGHNINHECGATHPEAIQNAVISAQADIGFAFDGDGDRVVAVGKNGIIKDGDDILALLLDHPTYGQEPTLVCTIMSNAGLEEFVTQKNKSIIRTPVGDKHISAELKNKNLLLGGEQSGHILLADFLNGGDGIFAALRICEVAELRNNWNLNSFEHMAQIMTNLAVEHKRDLQDPVLQEIINSHKTQLLGGTLIIRYSGTENLLRVMIQHKDQSHAEKVSAQLVTQLKQALTLVKI